MLQLFREVKSNRELIWSLAMKDLRVRYKRSTLGFLWALLNPILMMIVYVIVFSTVLGSGMQNYAVFLISGMFPWTFFSQGIIYCIASIVGNNTLIQKVYIDKSVFPVSAILANLINFAFSMIAMVVLLLAMQYPFHWTWIYFPIPLICLIIIALGLGFICATVNVFFRDAAHIVQILLTAGFYLSGIIYPLNIIPAKYQIILKLNPMVYIIDGFHSAIYYGSPPNFKYVIVSLVCSVSILIIGYIVFRRSQNTFVYYL